MTKWALQNARGPHAVGTAASPELQTNFPETSAVYIAHLSKAIKPGFWRIAFA